MNSNTTDILYLLGNAFSLATRTCEVSSAELAGETSGGLLFPREYLGRSLCNGVYVRVIIAGILTMGGTCVTQVEKNHPKISHISAPGRVLHI